ncbi:hypothetical protein LCGC14_0374290 [marine sediment metagenome]|uniref:Uncharacterized protein n=1 Tax=marine sediment metagenome TaxID=412755 RepID=A0A0F9TA05_9ZZZZ
MNFPKEVRVVECKRIELATKDIITIKKEEDFIWLLNGGTVFKLDNSYYILQEAVAYIYTKNDKR